jgi:hypothetical protein
VLGWRLTVSPALATTVADTEDGQNAMPELCEFERLIERNVGDKSSAFQNILQSHSRGRLAKSRPHKFPSSSFAALIALVTPLTTRLG